MKTLQQSEIHLRTDFTALNEQPGHATELNASQSPEYIANPRSIPTGSTDSWATITVRDPLGTVLPTQSPQLVLSIRALKVNRLHSLAAELRQQSGGGALLYAGLHLTVPLPHAQSSPC